MWNGAHPALACAAGNAGHTQVTAVMLKTISGVAASSRRVTDSGEAKHSLADTGHQLNNGSSHNGSGAFDILNTCSSQLTHALRLQWKISSSV